MSYRAEAVIKPKGYKAEMLALTVDTEAEAIEKVRTFLLPTALRNAIYFRDGEDPEDEDAGYEDFGHDLEAVSGFIASSASVGVFLQQLEYEGQLSDPRLLIGPHKGVWPPVGTRKELDLLVGAINDRDGYYVGDYSIEKA